MFPVCSDFISMSSISSAFHFHSILITASWSFQILGWLHNDFAEFDLRVRNSRGGIYLRTIKLTVRCTSWFVCNLVEHSLTSFPSNPISSPPPTHDLAKCIVLSRDFSHVFRPLAQTLSIRMPVIWGQTNGALQLFSVGHFESPSFQLYSRAMVQNSPPD